HNSLKLWNLRVQKNHNIEEVVHQRHCIRPSLQVFIYLCDVSFRDEVHLCDIIDYFWNYTS
ncbi:hypothetical protein IRJ41_011999, partial [Triplophysa rosa]